MDKSIFLQVFGDTPFFKVLDFLIENQGFDYSKTEIAKGAGIGWSTLFKVWPQLEMANLVKVTREFGNTKLYTLNTDNPIVKELLKLEMIMIEYFADIDTSTHNQG